MIGVGWVTAMGSWLTSAGPVGTMLAFAAGGCVMLAIGLCYAEVTSMLPVAGGEVAYAYRAYGTATAFLVGWFLTFGYVSVSAFEAVSVGRVLSFMFPFIDIWPIYQLGGEPVYGSHLLMAFAFTGLITYVNYVGVVTAVRFQKWLIAGFILITAMFIGVGIAGGQITHLQPAVPAGGVRPALAGILAVLVTVPFWFVGFDTIPQGAEEADVSLPPRQLGILILASICCATLFYVVLVFSVSMIGPWETIASADLPTAHAFRLAFSSPILVNLVLTAALIGLLTSWNGFFLAGSRVLFALGRGRIIRPSLGDAHPVHHTPHRAVLFVGFVTALAPLLGRDALVAFVDVGSFCIALAFLGVSLTVTSLRKKYPLDRRPFSMPAPRLIPRLAAACSLLLLLVMLIPMSPAALTWPTEVLILAGVTTLGFTFWVSGAASRRATSESERESLIFEDHASGDP
jgi:amino acid transporter